MVNRSFPSWSGPLVGSVAGAVLSVTAAQETAPAQRVTIVIFGAGCGFLAGMLVWLADRPSQPTNAIETSEPGPVDTHAGRAQSSHNQPSDVGRVFAPLSLLLFCIPYFGL